MSDPVQTSRGPANGPTVHTVFEPHPLLPLPTAAQMAAAMAKEPDRAALLKFLNERRRALDLAKADPLNHRLRLPGSRVVDQLLQKYQIVYEAGGKRAGKTVDGVPRFLKCCLAYGKAKRWCMQDNAKSSIANLQQLVWENLPESIQKLNMRGSRDPNVKYRVHYKPDTGFDGVLILPNECEIHFLNYTMNPSDYLGWKLGKAIDVPLDPDIPDIGALLDENCPLAWLDNIIFRVSDLGAKIHWMYSPQDGITPAIKAVTRGAVTVESAPADLLADRVNIPGLPKGHMPRVRTCLYGKVEVGIYHRFTQDNPFSRYHEKGGLREVCEGRDKDFIMRNAYGYCEDVRGRACPKFGEWNIVAPEAVPADGTNYMVTDPAGARNWFTFWARAVPGGDLFIYREWPNWQDFGDWAVVSQNPKKLNGDRGPAQPTIGYGPAQYKNLFLQQERIIVPQAILKASREDGGLKMEELDELLKSVSDPHHRARIKRAVRPVQWPDRPEDLDDLREIIFERLIDPRAAKNQSASDGAFADLVSKLEAQNRDERTGKIIAEPMDFIPAPGLDLRDGISAINELLYFNDKEERIALINAPKLYVSRACRNLIWALSTYSLPTDSETTDDACEDPMDGLRYLATRGARYVVAGGKVKTRGGGSY